ncbi:DUF922 domain-containing Zn-dependent protease [Spongiibacter taiwanensis]|uniref:DUF922 domain-containing Zn-dependent protease n=1 Tax=Spongiibacter taiwanensis TaxID=1748242 RepID=UPI002035D2B3|nr:DUF922 domain-containing protein [Spongiibacter taiwanensis]USA42884.1 DUF922 domain-containing Zn-dependent protease [Spongiibacter taiwanensis]
MLLAQTGLAEPEVETQFRYYPVVVHRLEGMQAAVEAASPMRRGDRVYHGFTESQVNWKWWWIREDGRCRISRVDSQVQIVYTLPRLQTDSRNFRIRGVWSEWFWALKQHELNHGDNAIAVAREGEVQIMAIPAAVNCAEVDAEASRIAAALIEELKYRDAEYDRLTDHGARETGDIRDHY